MKSTLIAAFFLQYMSLGAALGSASPRDAASSIGGLRGGPGFENHVQDAGTGHNDAAAVSVEAGRKLFGTCGNGNAGDGVCSDPALCCSSFGWCGIGTEYCGGAPPGPTSGGTCGNGDIGNGRCSDPATCCSIFGWCGTGVDFCGGSPTTSSGVTPVEMCDGDGGTCICGKGGDGTTMTLNRFWGDSLDEQVWGCGGAFHLDGLTLDSQWGGNLESTSQSMGVSFSQGDSFNGWEGCCALCGMNLEIAGKLSSGWYCEKDWLSTGIWLKH